MSTGAMIALSFLEAALLVIILSIGLNQVRRRLTNISSGLATLAGALATVESQHLRGLMKWVADVNGPLEVIAAVLPGSRRRPRSSCARRRRKVPIVGPITFNSNLELLSACRLCTNHVSPSLQAKHSHHTGVSSPRAGAWPARPRCAAGLSRAESHAGRGGACSRPQQPRRPSPSRLHRRPQAPQRCPAQRTWCCSTPPRASSARSPCDSPCAMEQSSMTVTASCSPPVR